ncbi:MAG: hypothetical protein WBP41_08410 [Saprospiraceae bacterium]
MKKRAKTKKSLKTDITYKSESSFVFSKNKSDQLERAFNKILEEERDYYLKEELEKYKNVKFVVL